MDSFSMLFQRSLGASEVCALLNNSGFDAHCQSARKIAIANGEARVWIEILSPQDLDASDFEDEFHWPIPRNQVGSLLSLSVRRNFDSETLAVKIADRLANSMQGAILWDGMDNWEEKYKAYIEDK